jgi:hypothetical protein
MTTTSPSLPEKPSKAIAAFSFVGLLAVFLTSILLRLPDQDTFTICLFKNLTGFPCPGCGLTHSFCALGKGEIREAFAFNLMGPPLFLVLIGVWIRSACVLLNSTDLALWLDKGAARVHITTVFVVSFLVYGVVRIAYLLST